MKTLIITLLFLTFSTSFGYSQCSISIMSNNVEVDTVVISLGDSVDLYAEGYCSYSVAFNDFNNGTIGSGWYSNASPMFNNPCPPILPPASGNTCWIGYSIDSPRYIITSPFDLSSCTYTIEFDMKFGDVQNSVNCDNPDSSNEGIYLQFSIDSATTWQDINYWQPASSIGGPLYTWTHYLVIIPPTAYTQSTQFRWYQGANSGKGDDHWGIDNVNINGNCSTIVNWSTGQTVFDPPPMYPTQTTDITCYIMNILNGDFAIDTVHVIVNPWSSIEETDNRAQINIFPNPSDGNFKFQISNFKKQLELQIMNIHGQTILNNKISSSTSVKEINLSYLPKGVYFITFRSENIVWTERFVIR